MTRRATCHRPRGSALGRWLQALSLAVCLAAAVPAPAQESASSAAEAAAIVESRTQGRVLGVRRDGGVYRVKVLTGRGRVRTVTVRAR